MKDSFRDMPTTVETVYKHHPRWKANAMLIASYVYVQILF